MQLCREKLRHCGSSGDEGWGSGVVGVNVVEEGASVDLFEVLCGNGVVDVSMRHAMGGVLPF